MAVFGSAVSLSAPTPDTCDVFINFNEFSETRYVQNAQSQNLRDLSSNVAAQITSEGLNLLLGASPRYFGTQSFDPNYFWYFSIFH